MINEVFSVLKIFNKYNKKKIHYIVSLSAIATFIESLSILLLIPFIQLFINGNNSNQITFKNELIIDFLEMVNIEVNLNLLILFIFLGFLIKAIFLFLILVNIADYKGQFYKNIRDKFYSSFSKMSYQHFQKIEIGHYSNLITEQSHKALEGLNNYIQFCSLLISSFIYLLILTLISPYIIIITLIAGIFSYIYFKRINNEVKNSSINLSNSNSFLSKIIIETLNSHKYLLATNQNDKISGKIKSNIDRISKIVIKFGKLQAITQSIREPYILTFILILISINILIFQKEVSIIFVSLLILYRALNNLISVQGNWQSFLSHIGAIYIIDKEISNLEKAKDFNINFNDLNYYKEYNIEFKNVDFKYVNREKYIFKNLNLKIPNNSFIYLLGNSGSGKSTFLDLTIGLLKPTSGNVLNDDEDIDYKRHNNLGFVPQFIQIIDDTIEKNISFDFLDRENNHRDKIKLKVIEIAKKVELHDFIMSLPENYNTVLGDMGLSISGGQRQRLAIAREIYRNPKILILDEGTNSLDKETELKIINTLKNISKNITIIFSTHNEEYIKKNDKFIRISKNRVLSNL